MLLSLATLLLTTLLAGQALAIEASDVASAGFVPAHSPEIAAKVARKGLKQRSDPPPICVCTQTLLAAHVDLDGDGVPNGADAFLVDASEWSDLDGDGIGDNGDDSDADGLTDAEDRFPLGDPFLTVSVDTRFRFRMPRLRVTGPLATEIALLENGWFTICNASSCGLGTWMPRGRSGRKWDLSLDSHTVARPEYELSRRIGKLIGVDHPTDGYRAFFTRFLEDSQRFRLSVDRRGVARVRFRIRHVSAARGWQGNGSYRWRARTTAFSFDPAGP